MYILYIKEYQFSLSYQTYSMEIIFRRRKRRSVSLFSKIDTFIIITNNNKKNKEYSKFLLLFNNNKKVS